MGFFDRLFGTTPDYTVRDNNTKREISVRDAKELENFAKKEQERDSGYQADKDFVQRIFSR